MLVATVLDGCGTPEEVTELACRAGFPGGELDVQLAAGQSTTVVVGGYLADEQGPYSLEATFTAQ